MKKYIYAICFVLLGLSFTTPISAEPNDGKDVTSPQEIEGKWYGFYRDMSTDEFSIYDLTLYTQDKNHVIAYWKLVDENGVVFNRGVSEGDVNEKGLILFELDSTPVRYLYVRILSRTTLLGLYQQEIDKKVSSLGYFMVFRD